MTEAEEKRLKINDMANRMKSVFDFTLFYIKSQQKLPSIDSSYTEKVYNNFEQMAKTVDELANIIINTWKAN